MTAQRPPLDFPSVIDSTMLGAWRACHTRFWRLYGEHWKPQGESIHLRAGRAFADGLERARRAFYEEGCTPAEAQQAGVAALLGTYSMEPVIPIPEGSAKSAERMAGAL